MKSHYHTPLKPFLFLLVAAASLILVWGQQNYGTQMLSGERTGTITLDPSTTNNQTFYYFQTDQSTSAWDVDVDLVSGSLPTVFISRSGVASSHNRLVYADGLSSVTSDSQMSFSYQSIPVADTRFSVDFECSNPIDSCSFTAQVTFYSHHGLTGGGIAAIVILTVGFAVALLVGIVWVIRKRRAAANGESLTSNSDFDVSGYLPSYRDPVQY